MSNLKRHQVQVMESGKFASDSAVKLVIGGINVKFPVKPYPSQLSMMSMIIKGLQKGQHCLLESPTGSGKSLALLCSALAWQQAQHDKADEDLISRLKAAAEKESLPCTCNKGNKSVPLQDDAPTSSKYFGECKQDDPTSVIDLCTPEEEDDDFKLPGKSTGERKQKSPDAEPCCLACNADKSKCGESMEEERVRRPRVPKIWFGTRTHKQIAQIAKELGRTSYDSTKMTILSSRRHSCIHPAVVKSANKNEECRDLRRGTHVLGAKCAFYQNVHRMKHHDQLMCAGMSRAWDLEELVGLGKTIKACPFYSARELVSSSNIIFCPYNYLIDPMIRSQMQINLNNQVIILDEGHNIEDCAREAGSFTLTETDLANTTSDLEFLINDGVKTEDHRPLHLLCMRLGQWMHQHSQNLKSSDYETSSDVWCGRDITTHLREWGISEITLPLLEGNFSAATDLGEEDVETAKLLHSSSQATLGGLFNVLRYLMAENNKYCDDYRITVIRQSVFGPVPPKRTREGWVTLHKKSKKHFVTNLHFWCLNPAVAFNDLSKAHCIILTSGTLSPLSSFSSELGLSFPIQLEANHVIHDSQVWVGSVGKGPKGIQLEATYKNTDKFEFQDELGELVNHICHIIPYGVLCFFSSYSMLQKQQERWKTTGLWGKIQEVKVVVCEPRSSNKEEFDSLLQSFYDVVEESSTSDDITGALLLAVCRGKVSEGLDFADNNARAVITVGIPFPSIKDKQVELKRKYNDMHKTQRGLLSGAQWYEIQAFRAMNQALGRCIRHKNDWGALIIVDDRFCKNPQKYSKGLSKWVRQKMRPQVNFDCAVSSITAFVQGWSSMCGDINPLPIAPSSQKDNTTTLVGCHDSNVPDDSPTKQDTTPGEVVHTEEQVTSHADNLPNVKASVIPKNSTKPETQEDWLASMEEKQMFNGSSDTPVKSEYKAAVKTSVKSKLKTSRAEGVKKQSSFKRVENFSEDEVEIYSDDDFQVTHPIQTSKHSAEKTKMKHSAKKSKEKTVKVSNAEPLVNLIKTENLDEATVNDLLNEEFDCTIPATPEKEDLTIIPESPASLKKKSGKVGRRNTKLQQALDFSDEQLTTPRKRKPSSPSHTDDLTPSLKRKDSSPKRIHFDGSEKNGKWSSAGVSTELVEECSGEFLPRSRRRRMSKNAVLKSASTNVCCRNCNELLHSCPQPLEAERVDSKFLSSEVTNRNKTGSCKVYIVDKTSSSTDQVAVVIHEEKGSALTLNSYWCSEDNKCYQAYRCLSCSRVVCYSIVSDPAFYDRLLFPCKFVKAELTSCPT